MRASYKKLYQEALNAIEVQKNKNPSGCGERFFLTDSKHPQVFRVQIFYINGEIHAGISEEFSNILIPLKQIAHKQKDCFTPFYDIKNETSINRNVGWEPSGEDYLDE